MPAVAYAPSGSLVFCPRCAVVTKARPRSVPAKITSLGASPTSNVRTTRGGVAATSTMLMLSERWLTTQASPSVRSDTATGSRPTGTAPARTGVSPLTSKISRYPSGVFTAYSRCASDDSASGLEGIDSKSQ